MLKTRHHALLIAGLALPLSTACATKGFVTQSVEERATVIESRVASVETELDGVADDTRTNTARIGEVDQTATTALGDAGSAGDAAATAQTTASDALTRTTTLEEQRRQLIFESALSENHGMFGFAGSSVSDEAAANLDALYSRVQALDAPVNIEIEGHTDGTGDPLYNHELGLMRAEAVRRYLHERHQFPLHKISVISYGEESPVAPNDTAEGRAQNRRVVIRVLQG